MLANGHGIYTVSSLHSHTPMQYIPAINRIVGPSSDDTNASVNLPMPGLVYDYVEFPEGSGTIPGGHPTNATARLYPTEACPRRPYR